MKLKRSLSLWPTLSCILFSSSNKVDLSIKILWRHQLGKSILVFPIGFSRKSHAFFSKNEVFWCCVIPKRCWYHNHETWAKRKIKWLLLFTIIMDVPFLRLDTSRHVLWTFLFSTFWFLRLHIITVCPYSEVFWSVFSRIRIEYGEIRSICLYSVRMWENADQKNSEYGYFSRSEFL